MARQSTARTAEDRERELIALAVNQAEKMLEGGKAPTSVLLHYLQLGATDYPLKKERLVRQNEMFRAKTEAIERTQDYEQVARNALEAMQRYSGNGGEDVYFEEML